VHAIHGRERVEEVELLDVDSGRSRQVACDVVVFTADWIPDHELAVVAGLEFDPATRGPRVDTGLHTSRAGVFAGGNVLHGAEPADIAALSGRHAAGSVTRWLTDGMWPRPLPIVCKAPLHWISPSAVGSVPPPRHRFLVRATEFLRAPTLELRQDGRVLWRGRLRHLMPGRSASLPWEWIGSVDPEGGAVELGL
jgi:hypothetical protein